MNKEQFNPENCKNLFETSQKVHRKSLQEYYCRRKQSKAQEAWPSEFSIFVFASITKRQNYQQTCIITIGVLTIF